MVKPTRLGDRPVHFCEICYLAYDRLDLAQACEAHCRTHPSCDLAIGRQAVGSVDPTTV